MKITITLRENFTLNDWKNAKNSIDDFLFEVLSNTPNGGPISGKTRMCNGFDKEIGGSLMGRHIFHIQTSSESLENYNKGDTL